MVTEIVNMPSINKANEIFKKMFEDRYKWRMESKKLKFKKSKFYGADNILDGQYYIETPFFFITIDWHYPLEAFCLKMIVTNRFHEYYTRDPEELKQFLNKTDYEKNILPELKEVPKKLVARKI